MPSGGAVEEYFPSSSSQQKKEKRPAVSLSYRLFGGSRHLAYFELLELEQVLRKDRAEKRMIRTKDRVEKYKYRDNISLSDTAVQVDLPNEMQQFIL